MYFVIKIDHDDGEDSKCFDTYGGAKKRLLAAEFLMRIENKLHIDEDYCDPVFVSKLKKYLSIEDLLRVEMYECDSSSIYSSIELVKQGVSKLRHYREIDNVYGDELDNLLSSMSI